MDPISITGLVIEVSHVLSSLIRYAKSVQSAKSEVRKLTEELFALKGILEHLAAQIDDIPKWQESETSPFDGDVMARVLLTTNEFLQSLLIDLEVSETKFKRLKQALKWPFTQAEVSEHLIRLERVKSWLILVLTADHNSVDREMQQEVRDLTNTLKEDLEVRAQERNKLANRELLRWIAPVNPESSHLRASKRHRNGTGRWFIDGHLKTFLDQDENRAFFLLGKSGTGKTTLFAQVADELTYMASQGQSMCLAYFYCTISDFASQNARNVLGSLVAQLSRTDPSILDEIRSIYHKGPKNQAHRFPIELPVLEAAIVKSASEKTKVVLLIDAINESHDMQLLEASLLKLASLSTNIRVLITTTSTMSSINHDNVSFLNISGKSRGDIDTFVKYRLETDDTLRTLAPEFKAEIEYTLCRDADGSFRWVQLSLDNLSTQRSVRAMRQALKNLPSTLRETYANMLGRIAPDDWKIAQEALFWLSFTKQPLTLGRLNEIVVMDETSMTLDEDMMLVPPHILLEICQGLITEDQDGYLNLAHASVKDFLTSDWIRSSRVQYFALDPRTADLKAMHGCLTYLCLDNFAKGYLTCPENPAKLREDHPFMAYAANFWPQHGAACGFGDSEQAMVHNFFATRSLPGRGNYGTWMQVLLRTTAGSNTNDAVVIDRTHPLYYAASFGMVQVVESILASEPDIDINSRGGRVGATAVWIASLRFNFEVVDILLRAGADPSIRDPGSGLNVLDLLRMVPTRHRSYEGLRPILARPAPWKELEREARRKRIESYNQIGSQLNS
ncbi:NACHT nucleoside triphosphatase [Penicillium concentricum]|uniref:NACHT nucleoside triphosphatase n=1 Tax=Penicillium concentricum TaxID=293559 RepID=A0A9W9S8G5_9EURO|nr:NACHT nucleoside triphosphatase [Penicillium concentricum]KAJ5374002.1 NACHT nucleoside triphosphatase [Penicillium concentricum]